MKLGSKPFRRSSGVLLHPTSLPGPYGVGDLGPEAFAWVDALAAAKQSWWQMLPLTPTGYGDSPYSSFSAFAGNVNLLSPDLLVQDGLVRPGDLAVASPADGLADYAQASALKRYLLARAWETLRKGRVPSLEAAFEEFCRAEAGWLDDFALFVALKESHGGAAWQEWEPALVRREPAALSAARRELQEEVGMHRLGQFLFFRQWGALRRHAAEQGVRLIGDLPIFIASDSADTWANQDLFLLDEAGRPRFVAGVPPDYFSKTGQLWGNPLYDWERHAKSGYSWWAARLRATLRLVDVVRLDHFRGFEAHWEVPAGMPTAEIGRWVKGPGLDLFEVLRRQLGGLPLIAEDLGVITPDVDELRTRFGLPGMRILQFAFGGAVERRFLPHNYERNTVVYTGTHDNDTTAGWFAGLTRSEAESLRRYLPGAEKDPSWALIRLAWGSVADLAVAPAQDLLGLGSEARMNRPGVAESNWRWRLRPGELTEDVVERLAEVTEVYERVPAAQ